MAFEITCDTNINDIISLDSINPILNSMEEETNSYENNIVSIIRAEIESGGLSSSGLNVNKEAVLSKKALSLIEGITIDRSMSDFRTNIIELCKAQRLKELNILLVKVDEKLIKLGGDYNILLESYSTDFTPQQLQNYNRQREALEGEISFYRQKYSTVEGMITNG
jgi:hypothetical protein